MEEKQDNAEGKLKELEIESKEVELQLKKIELNERVRENKLLRENKLSGFLKRYSFVSTASAAFLGLVVTGIGYFIQSSLNRGLERERLQGQLILKAIETGDSEKARANLKFFVQTGLLDDRTGKIAAALKEAEKKLETIPVLPSTGSTFDTSTERRLKNLPLETSILARKFLQLAREQGIDAEIMQGYRSREEQDALYAQGRTTPGEVVTNMKGDDPNCSHCRGTAFDVVPFKNGRPDWNTPAEVWEKLRKIGDSLGLSPDANDPSDKTHFELRPKNNIQ